MGVHTGVYVVYYLCLLYTSLTDATPEYFRTETRANRKCEGCGAVLWTATTAEEQSEWVRISHLGYVHRRFAYLARDACKTAAAKKQLAALLREPDRFMAARGACRRFPLSTLSLIHI